MSNSHTGEQRQPIKGDLITLGQLIKVLNLVSSGAEVKEFLNQEKILVNDEPENRRGRKLYPGDLVKIEGLASVRITCGL